MLRLVVAVAIAAAFGSPAAAQAGPCATRVTAPQTYQHGVWVVMENHSYTQIIGVPCLAGACSVASMRGAFGI